VRRATRKLIVVLAAAGIGYGVGYCWLERAREADAGEAAEADLDPRGAGARELVKLLVPLDGASFSGVGADGSPSQMRRVEVLHDAWDVLSDEKRPAVPLGEKVRLRMSDGSIVEIEPKPEDPGARPGAYPPENSRLDGTHLTVFHDNGQVAESGGFVDGAKTGAWTYWDSVGRLELEGEYVDGLAEGLWRAWHDNGRIAGESWTRKGQFHGECRFWNARGELDAERSGVYERGVRVRGL
jgi:hypothetical protein